MNKISRGQLAVLAGLLLGMLVTALDQNIVSTAMPRIAASLGGMALYSWTFTAYMLSSTTMVPIFGKLSDIYGRRRFFILGIVVFMVGSWLSGIAQTMEQLIIFRGLQGVGAAAVMPIAAAAIADVFPPAQRGQMQGFMAATWGVASVLGPVLGGYIADQWGWRWIFYVNIPVGFLSIAVSYLNLHDRPDPGVKRQIDYLGVITLMVGLVPLLLATALGGKEHPWNSPLILGMLFLAGVMLFLFPIVESKAQEPVIPLALFRNSIFTVSVISVFLVGISMFGVMVFLPLFLQAVVGVSATNSGLILTPMMLSMVATSTLGGQLMSRIGYRRIALVSMAVLTVGAFLLATMDPHTTNQQAVIYMIVMGLGLGPTMPLFVIAVQNSVEYARMGIATSSIQFFRSMGGTVGVTVLGTLMAGSLDAAIAKQASSSQALAGAEGLGDVQFLLDPSAISRIPPAVLVFLKDALTSSIHQVFLVGLGVIVAAFLATLFLREIPLRKTWEAAPAMAGAKEGRGLYPQTEISPADPPEE